MMKTFLKSLCTVLFLSGFSQAINYNYQRVFDVTAYGATGDGVTNDAGSIQAAITAAMAVAQSSANVLTTQTAPIVFLPKGIYRLSSTLNIGSNLVIQGSKSILLVDPGILAISLQGCDTNFRDLIFQGGASSLFIQTNNLDVCLINLDNDEFMQQTSTVIYTDTNSASTQLNVYRSRFYNLNPSSIIGYFPSADFVIFDKDWVETESLVVFKNYVNLSLNDFLGVPLGTPSAVWIENHGTIIVSRSRFGGEFNGNRIVDNYADSGNSITGQTAITIENSTTYSPDYSIRFFQLPNIVKLRGNVGITNGPAGLYFDAGISTTTLASWGKGENVWDIEDNAFQSFAYFGSSVAAGIVSNMPEPKHGSLIASTTDQVYAIPINSGGGGGQIQTLTNMTVSNSVDYFGNFAYSAVVTSFPGAWVAGFISPLNSLPAGFYTAVYDVNLVSGAATVGNFLESSLVVRDTILPGVHEYSIPFYWNANSSAPSLQVQLNQLPVGTTVVIGRIRVYRGTVEVDSENSQVVSDSLPAIGNWNIGDRAINANPSVGQPKAWTCVGAGSPGTWNSEGNL